MHQNYERKERSREYPETCTIDVQQVVYYTVGHISGVFTDLWAQMQGAGTKEQAISYAHLDLRQGWDKARAYLQPTFSFTSLIEIGCSISCVQEVTSHAEDQRERIGNGIFTLRIPVPCAIWFSVRSGLVSVPAAFTQCHKIAKNKVKHILHIHSQSPVDSMDHCIPEATANFKPINEEILLDCLLPTVKI